MKENMDDEMPFSLAGKKAMITGGGTGIGYGIAEVFVKAGAQVILIGRREDVLKNACNQLGAKSSYRCFDLANQHQIPAFVDDLELATSGIDILVNNAGKHHKDFVVNTTDADFLAVMQTNLLSVFSLTREVAKYMLQRKQGSIILISSMTAGVAMDKVVGYATSKTALLGMMRTMAVEFAPSNVRINAIAPGWIQSDMLDKALAADPIRKQKIIGRIPAGRFGHPSDIGRAALFLASDASSYINNVMLPVDGAAFQAL